MGFSTAFPGNTLQVVDPFLVSDVAGVDVVGTFRNGGRSSGVVLVPGIFAWRGLEEIDVVAQFLSARHDVLSIDVGGHGHDRGRFTWGREEWGQVAAAARRLAADGRRVSVVGFSFGGYHAAAAACRDAPIDRLVLVGAPVDLRLLDHFPLGRRFWSHLPVMLRRRRKIPRMEWPRHLRDRAFADGELSRIRGRTLVVHGELDWLVSRRHAARYASRIPGARLLEIPGGLHAEYLVDSSRESFLPALGEFCE